MGKKFKKYNKWVLKNKFLLTLLLIFAFELFLRFYQMDLKNPFGYDQVDNAWAAKNILVNHRFPLVGMVAKTNSGIYIGPAYYYLISVFYALTNLNPVASEIFAGLTSIFTFWTLYFFSKKLFNKEIALIAVLINTFALPAIIFDRIQWPVDFIPAISLIIFYLIYRVMMGDVKKIMFLAIAVGFMFNIHFTAIFFPIIIFFCLPFFPRRLETIKYCLISIPLFLIWLIPNIAYTLSNKTSGSNIIYLNTYSHGFHLKRMIQIIGDSVVQFDPYVIFDWIKKIKIIFPIIFIIVYFKKTVEPAKFKFLYLILLYFLVPWVIFTIYSGEMSDYYFSNSRFIALLIIAYLIYSVWSIKNLVPKIVIAILLSYYCIFNFINFLPYTDEGLYKRESRPRNAATFNQKIDFQVGVPESYIYYYFMRQKGKDVY